jgi:DNA-binding LacI/PurR family transcriptional regulator
MRNNRPRRFIFKDVEAIEGVSGQIVSKVTYYQDLVSKETDQRTWQAIETINFRPIHTARALHSQRSFTLGYS